MTKELYNLTVWYIKAYCYYKDVHDELFDEAAHIGGIEYDKEKVQSSNIYDNPKLIECAAISIAVDKAFSPLIKCIEKVSEESRNRIIKNIAYPKNRNYINVTCREELYHQQFDFIKSVAKELIMISKYP